MADLEPSPCAALRNAHRRPPRVRALVAAAATALAACAAAAAHVTIAPPFVEADAPTRIAFEMPNERQGRVTVTLDVDAPPGVELAAAPAPAGWKLDVTFGRHARWTGGRIAGRRTVAFPLEVTARRRAGTATFRAVQGYDDGEVVRWNAALSILPATAAEAPPQHLRRALTAGTVGLLVIAGSFLALRLLRRKPLQER
jgi:uncharacterized protein DUF1775